MPGSGKSDGRRLGFKASQELVVVAISIVLFIVFSATLNNFLSQVNIIAILKNVSILGTLAVGMGLIVVGRGIDHHHRAGLCASLFFRAADEPDPHQFARARPLTFPARSV